MDDNQKIEMFIQILWTIWLFYFFFQYLKKDYEKKKLQEDAKKAQIETAKYLKILAENSQNQKENSQN